MVDRVARILEIVARSKTGMTLTEVATELEAPVSSVQSLLNGLVATGYLDERSKVYRLGTATYLLNSIAGRPAVSRVMHSDLQSIHDETGMTTLLAISVGTAIYFVDYVGAGERYAYLAEQHVRRSMIRTSAGVVMLADMPRRDVWAYFDSLDESDSARVETYFRIYQEVKATGICAAPGLAADGDGISIAVRERGRVVAAVSAVGTREDVRANEEAIVACLKRHAQRWNQEDPF